LLRIKERFIDDPWKLGQISLFVRSLDWDIETHSFREKVQAESNFTRWVRLLLREV